MWGVQAEPALNPDLLVGHRLQALHRDGLAVRLVDQDLHRLRARAQPAAHAEVRLEEVVVRRLGEGQGQDPCFLSRLVDAASLDVTT